MRFILLTLAVLVVFPAYAQEQSEQKILLTDKGTLQVGFSTIPSHPNLGEQTKLKIDFINKNTKSIQEHIDYKVIISKDENQVFTTQLTHTATGSITIPYEFQEAGQYQISVSVQEIVFAPIPSESVAFTLYVEESKKPNSGCLIATAAFGSELAPQVQFLREYRDTTVMTTIAGSSFLNVFNTVYYSFSPIIADAERNNPVLQESIRAGITPLLGILQIVKIISVGEGETSVLTSGIIASSFIGASYFWPVAIATKSVREGRRFKIVIITTLTTTILALVSTAVGNVQFLSITLPVMVLALVITGAMFSAWAIWKIVLKIKITFL